MRKLCVLHCSYDSHQQYQREIEKITKMHQENIGTFLLKNRLYSMKTSLYNKHSFSVSVSLLCSFFLREVCCPDKSWLTIKEIYRCICNNLITIEKYIELNDPNWNVSIVHKCSTPFRFILSLEFAIAAVCHHTYYYYHYCFVPFDIVLKRVKGKHFYGFCFVLLFSFFF